MKRNELIQLASVEEEHWWFVERRNLLRLWAQKCNVSDQLLDIGAGAGRQSLLLSEEFGLQVDSLENSEFGQKAILDKGLNLIYASATSIPMPNNYYDGIVAMDVLEHIPEDEKAISEFFRVIKPGGNLFITVPAFQFLWSSHDVAVDHVRRYSKRELVRKFEEAGLEVNYIRFWNSILFPLGLISRLICSASDLKMPSALVNRLLKFIIKLERNSRLIGKIPGTSLILFATKIGQ